MISKLKSWMARVDTLVSGVDAQTFNSDMLAVFLAETLICAMVDAILPIPYLSVVVTALLMVAGFTVNRRRFGRYFFGGIRKVAAIYAILLVSVLLNGVGAVANYFVYFTCFGLGAWFFTAYTVKTERVTRSLSLIYGVYLVFYFLFLREDFLQSENRDNSQMGVAYGLTPIVLLAALALTYPEYFARSLAKKLFMLALGVAALAVMLVDTMTRGALVAVAVGVVCFVLTRLNKRQRWISLTVLAVLGLVGILFYKELLQLAADLLGLLGLHIGALDKMLFMMAQGTADNGREELTAAALELFLRSPLIGHGVGAYEKMQGMYAHNILLQLLCEYGIVGAALFLLWVVKLVRGFFTGRLSPARCLEMLLFCYVMSLLMFSNSYWLLPHFWILFFFAGRSTGKKGPRRRRNVLAEERRKPAPVEQEAPRFGDTERFTMKTVSVIIPMFNSQVFLADLFAHLDKCDFRYGDEIIIIDNGSTDRSAQMCREQVEKRPELYKLCSFTDKADSYASRNFGVKQAKGDIFAFTDSDCKPTPAWLEAVRGIAPGEVIAGDVVLEVRGKGIWEKYDSVAHLSECADNAKKHCVATANMSVHAEDFHKVGNFAERFSGGDFEWSNRAFAAGLNIVFHPEALVYHPSRKTYEEIRKREERVAYGRGVNHKNNGKPYITLLVAYILRIFKLSTQIRAAQQMRQRGASTRDLVEFHAGFLWIRVKYVVFVTRGYFGKNPRKYGIK